jgi:hypothetical protein
LSELQAIGTVDLVARKLLDANFVVGLVVFHAYQSAARR